MLSAHGAGLTTSSGLNLFLAVDLDSIRVADLVEVGVANVVAFEKNARMTGVCAEQLHKQCQITNKAPKSDWHGIGILLRKKRVRARAF